MSLDSGRNQRLSSAGRGHWLLAISLSAALWPAAVSCQESPAGESGPMPLDEVIVTARKTEERLQDVPMSLQVVPADLLDTTDTSHVLQLQYSVPGLVVNNLGLNGAGFSLRAVASQGGSGASVATHMNGVYLGTSHLSTMRLFDMDRVEVLKGPQGTLYGRNATGGSINFISQAPEHEFSAELEAAYGSFDTLRAQGHLNLPFDHSALRLAFTASSGDGFIRNSVDDRRFAENDFWGMRASYRIAVTDRLQVDIMAQHGKDDGAKGELWLPRPDFLPEPADIRLTTVTLADPYLVHESNFVSIDADYDLGFASLQSTSAYAHSKVRDLDDCAGLPILAGCVRSVAPDRHDQLSQEFRLVSRADGTVDWLVGASYHDDDGFRDYFQLTPLIDPNPTSDNESRSAETVYAAYGQAAFRLGTGWTVTGGIRLSREDRRLSTFGTGTEDSPLPVNAEDSWDKRSWRLDLQYAFTDELLAYAGVSTGFKSGGFDILPGGVVDRYDPEHLNAYEIGIKSRWLNRRVRLNGAAFFYDFGDLQVSTSTVTESGLIFETDNAARAEIYGIDTDGVLQLTRKLSFSAGIVWLPKREFVEYRNDRTGDTLSGNKLSRAPGRSATAAIDYKLQRRQGGEYSARIEYNYRSGYFYTIDNDPRFAQGSFGLCNLYLEFQSAGEEWYVFASGRNLGNVDYFNQVFLQASPGEPDTYEAGFGYRF
jgi:iron complex outermembrane receptor protein